MQYLQIFSLFIGVFIVLFAVYKLVRQMDWLWTVVWMVLKDITETIAKEYWRESILIAIGSAIIVAYISL